MMASFSELKSSKFVKSRKSIIFLFKLNLRYLLGFQMELLSWRLMSAPRGGENS